MEKIVVFGASLGGVRALRTIGRHQIVVAVCDNDASKHGTRFHGRPVISPTELDRIDFDRIIIASSFYTEIFDQLVQQGISMDRLDILESNVLLGSDERQRKNIGTLLLAALILGFAFYGVYALAFGC